MSAKDWETTAEDFEGYGGHLTLASFGAGSLYVEITNEDTGESVSLAIEQKYITSIAHWIIKEHG